MENKDRTFHITLTTLEPFRIGALQNPLSGLDNPVATVGGRVVVQGSSLKGAFRAEIERHLIQEYANANDAMRPCIPSAKNTLSNEEKKLIDTGKTFKDGGGCNYSRNKKSPTICPACYLLGSQGLNGFVRVPYLFTDLLPEDLYSLRMDRATGNGAEKTNRDYQIMSRGVEFSGIMDVLVYDSVRDWELGRSRVDQDVWLKSGEWDADRIIKEFITDRLESIEVMGGFKSKGCGCVSISVEEIDPKQAREERINAVSEVA